MSSVLQPTSRVILASSASALNRGYRIFPWRMILVFVLFLVTYCWPASAQGQADITVDATTTAGTINPLIVGQNVLFTNGMWDTRTNDLHTGAAPLVHNLAPWGVRFPGGSTADLYFWEDGIGLKTTAMVSAGISAFSLEAAPNWGTVSSGRFIDSAEGQFGDTFTFTTTNGTQLQGVAGVSASHLAGAEVRPGPRQGQPESFSNQYGIDEHMKLATSLGSEPILTVNYGTGRDRTGALSPAPSLSQRVKRAVAWVAYLNGSSSDSHPLGIDAEGNNWQTVGYWAQKRAQRGHPAPYDVRYWEIGNEVYGNWEAGFTTARQYASDFSVFASTMKSIDPSIEVGAVGLADPHGRGDADGVDEWNATVVRIAGDTLDFLAIHSYYPSANLTQVQGSYTSTTWFTAVMAGAQQATKDLQDIRALLSANTARAAQIELAVTEYGIWPADSTVARDYSNLARALYDADLLLQLLRQGEQLGVSLATAWNLHGSNQTAAIRYDWSTGTRLVRPQYYAYQLVNELGPQLHSVTVHAPVFSTAQVGNVDAATSIPTLTAVAGSDTAGQLTLLVLNRSLSDVIPTSIRLTGYTPQSTAVTRTLTGDSLAANNEINASAVVLVTSSITSAAATFNYTFPPRSLTLIELQATSGSTATPPTAVITATLLQGRAPLTVTFDGSGSKAAGSAQIVSYSWDFGDGNKATGMMLSHTYTNPGTYIASLSVKDSAGLSGTATATISVTKAKGGRK